MINLKFLIVLGCLCSSGRVSVAQATISPNLVASNDTTKSVTIRANEAVKIIRNEEEIILKRGELLEVSLGDHKELSQVRIHSSLGRLVKQFWNVSQKVFLDTEILLPGVYLIVIKREESREIRKFIVTN
ncbi:MAG: T9SS type A sorting domain-containing protein [Microscillaceae bacterium]|nr:T9SS type A sorting domain-containing protein [Microscillaceae bacterium]